MYFKQSLKPLHSLLFKSPLNSTRTFNLGMSAACNKNNFKVIVTQQIPNEALQILQAGQIDATINTNGPLQRDELLKGVKNVDALFCTLNEKIDKELLETAGSKLKVQLRNTIFLNKDFRTILFN